MTKEEKIKKIREIFVDYDNKRLAINRSFENWSNKVMWGFHFLNVMETNKYEEIADSYLDNIIIIISSLNKHIELFQKNILNDDVINISLAKINSAQKEKIND